LLCKEYKKEWLDMVDQLDIDDEVDKICTMTKEDIFHDLAGNKFKPKMHHKQHYGPIVKEIIPSVESNVLETMINPDDMPSDVKNLHNQLFDIITYVKGKFCKDNKFQRKKFKQYLRDLINGFCSNTRFENILMTNVRYISRPLAYL